MAFSARLVPSMLLGQHSVSDALGTDVMFVGREQYNLNLETLALVAMVLQIIQDLAPTVVTDDLLQQRLNLALDTGPNGDRSGWPGWALMQIRPEDLMMYGANLTDDLPTLEAKVAAYNAANP